MPQINIIGEGKASFGDFVVFSAIIKLKHSYLTLVTDQEEYGIGTLTLATAPNELFESKGAASSPYNFFGLKYNLLTNVISKMLSKELKKPAMVMLLIKKEGIKSEIVMKTVVKAVKNALDNTN